MLRPVGMKFLTVCLLLATASQPYAASVEPLYSEISKLAPAARQKRLEEGARREGALTYYSISQTDLIAAYIKGFTTRYPFIKGDFYRGSGNQLVVRTMMEFKTGRLAAEAGAALEARGYHAQATPQEGSLALFHMNAGRQPIKPHQAGFLVGERPESAAALLEGVRSSPEEFSPSVLLRPIVQDTLFPTVCYVAGPNELAYLGQLRRVYDAFSTPMPLIQQRATATLLDSNAVRFLTRYDVALESLRAQDEAILNAVLEAQLPPSVESSLDEAVRTLEQRMERLTKEVVQIDPTLEGASRSTLSRMQDDLKKLHGKIIQAAKRKDETLRRQFQNARAQAFPGGEPQERAVGFVYFLNKYGPALVDRLYAELPVDAGTHWVMTI